MPIPATGPRARRLRARRVPGADRHRAHVTGSVACLLLCVLLTLPSCARRGTSSGNDRPAGAPGDAPPAVAEPSARPGPVSSPGSRPPEPRVTADPNAVTPDHPENVVIRNAD